MTDHKTITQNDQLAELQSKLESLKSQTADAEFFLATHPSHEPTLNRHNLLCHDKSETLAKIKRLQEKMSP